MDGFLALFRRAGGWFAAGASLALIACGAPATPAAETPRPESPAASAPAPPTPPAQGRASAPPPVPVPRDTGVANGAQVRAPVASLASMAEHALPVAVYGAEDPSRCGLKTPARANPPGSVQIFFGCTPRSGQVVGAVPARVVPVSSGRAERSAIEALLAGPTALERQEGYVSNFGEASRGIPFEVEIRGDGLAVVNFDQAIRSQAKAFISNLDARQVVATLGQFSGVRRVLILVEGEPLCRTLGEC